MLRVVISIFCLLSTFTVLEAVYPHPKNPTRAAQKVLHFWFGQVKSSEDFPKDKMSLWFGNNLQTDQEICQKFKLFMIAASKGSLDGWKRTPKGRLALIILLDQFPRNIYRGYSKAYDFDKMAQQIALEGIRCGHDRQLLPIERIFFYLPLEHAENLTLQKMSVSQFHQLVQESPHAVKQQYQHFHQYAVRHFEIIHRFGRFPHRNQILRRAPTSQEVEFLKQ